jgi:hypothetical protein
MPACAQSRVKTMLLNRGNQFGRGRVYFLCLRLKSRPDQLCGHPFGRVRPKMQAYAHSYCQIVNYPRQRQQIGRGRAYFLCLRPKSRLALHLARAWFAAWPRKGKFPVSAPIRATSHKQQFRAGIISGSGTGCFTVCIKTGVRTDNILYDNCRDTCLIVQNNRIALNNLIASKNLIARNNTTRRTKIK